MLLGRWQLDLAYTQAINQIELLINLAFQNAFSSIYKKRCLKSNGNFNLIILNCIYATNLTNSQKYPRKKEYCKRQCAVPCFFGKIIKMWLRFSEIPDQVDAHYGFYVL